MRTRYLVSYDIADPKRLRKVAKICEGFGVRLQFSVFECLLDGLGFQRIHNQLFTAIKHTEDQVLFVSLGPESGKSQDRYESIGLPMITQSRVTVI